MAVVVSVAVARRLSRPLRRTADAAHALAAGRRDVHVPVEGPDEVAEVASALNSLSSSLSRSEGRQRDFLLSVSHDLRTPLTGISGYAESLASGVVPPEETARVGGVVLTEAKRLERLVGDLLDLARLGADRPSVAPERTDLVALGREVESVWSRRCAAVGVPFTFVPAVAEAWTVTDPARVRQLVDGLLENALRVTPSGRPDRRRGARASAGSPDVRRGARRRTGPDRRRPPRRLRAVGAARALPRPPPRRHRASASPSSARLAQLLGGTVEAGHAAEGGARFTLRLPAPPPAHPSTPHHRPTTRANHSLTAPEARRSGRHTRSTSVTGPVTRRGPADGSTFGVVITTPDVGSSARSSTRPSGPAEWRRPPRG